MRVKGAVLRKALLLENNFQLSAIGTAINLANCTISKEILSPKTKNIQHRLSILEYFNKHAKEKVTFDLFWSKTVELSIESADSVPY